MMSLTVSEIDSGFDVPGGSKKARYHMPEAGIVMGAVYDVASGAIHVADV
jgi:hypothetical protein